MNTQKQWTIEEVIELIQKNLTLDLLKPQFRKDNVTNPMFGHCYVATETLYYLIREFKLPEKYLDYRPCNGMDSNNISHWWLKNKNGDILDPTSEQYTSKNMKPPYENGQHRSFLTKQPSKRTKTLIERINLSINIC